MATPSTILGRAQSTLGMQPSSILPSTQAPTQDAFQSANITSPKAVALHEGANMAAEKGIHGFANWASRGIPKIGAAIGLGAKTLAKGALSGVGGALVGDMILPKEASADADLTPERMAAFQQPDMNQGTRRRRQIGQ
jgi:hypothetical protein